MGIFTINFENLNCFFNCRSRCNDTKKIEISITELEKMSETTEPYVFINMFLGRIINLTDSINGFIYKTIPGNSAAYKALAVYGIAVNTAVLTNNIINIPLYHNEVFIGTMGLGLRSKNVRVDEFLESIEGLTILLSKYLFHHDF